MESATLARLTTVDFQALFDQCSNWGRWGLDDQRGTLNFITQEQTIRATGLVREGVSVSCALPINTVTDVENTSPAIHLMARSGDVVETWPTHSVADYLAMLPHGVSHTHLDAICHYSWQNQMYNGYSMNEVTSLGTQKNAITIGEQGIVSRGILLDLPRVQGVEWLEPGTAILPADLEAAERAEGLHVGQGDILMIRTGRHRRREVHGAWDVRKRIAGLDPLCVPWLRERSAALLGFDGISDVQPHRVDGVAQPIHTLVIAALGMQLLDNLNLEEIAGACAARSRWEVLMMVAPLRLERGTASAVNPIAVF